MSIGLKHIIKLFEEGNVCVTGLRGRGKDMLMSNVAVRRKKPYICNIAYDDNAIPLDLSELECGKNDYRNFINGDVKYYVFPYEDGTDVYISDAGIYFPSQYCNELNRDYKYLATFQALTRHLAEANFHINVQNINRCYDKIREQCDQYITCKRCIYIPLAKWTRDKLRDLVIQTVIVYDKYQSCFDRVDPYKPKVPLLASAEMRQLDDLERQRYRQTFGKVEQRILIYTNRSSYNTREFREKLANGMKK